MSTRIYHVTCLSEALSPITHMQGVEGNEAIINREAVQTEHGVAHLPVLSGNAIRHRMIREPGAEWLVDQYGLRGHLLLRQLNFLFHGGTLTESTGREDTSKLAEMRRLFPLLRLLGVSLPNQVCGGSLIATRGALVCRENQARLPALLPEGWELPDGVLRSAESLVSGWQYTRGDASRSKGDMWDRVADGTDPGGSSLMIYSGQEVIAGAHFLHGFTVRGSELELGALLHSLHEWGEMGGTIGGQASRGHGRLMLRYGLSAADGEPVDGTKAIEAYREHAADVRGEAVNWIYETFGSIVPEGVAG